MKKRKYYNSDSATSLFTPFGSTSVNRPLRPSGGMEPRARREYATNETAIKLLQLYSKLLSGALLFLFMGSLWLMDQMGLDPTIIGIVAGLGFGTLVVTVFFVLPYAFESYAYRRGWLKSSIKSNQRRR